MKPFEGNCDIPEEKQDNYVTVAMNRDGNKKVVQLINGSDTSVIANTGISLVLVRMATSMMSSLLFQRIEFSGLIAVKMKTLFTFSGSSSSSDDVGPLRRTQPLKRLKKAIVRTEGKKQKA